MVWVPVSFLYRLLCFEQVGFFVLQSIKIVVAAFLFEQVKVVALLNNCAVFNYQNGVGILDG